MQTAFNFVLALCVTHFGGYCHVYWNYYFTITLLEEGVTILTLPEVAEDLRLPESFIKEVKSDAKTKVLLKENEQIFEHVQTLMQHGNYFEITRCHLAALYSIYPEG